MKIIRNDSWLGGVSIVHFKGEEEREHFLSAVNKGAKKKNLSVWHFIREENDYLMRAPKGCLMYLDKVKA